MPATKKLEVTVTEAQEREMRRLVESGDYASTDQIIDVALGSIGVVIRRIFHSAQDYAAILRGNRKS